MSIQLRWVLGIVVGAFVLVFLTLSYTPPPEQLNMSALEERRMSAVTAGVCRGIPFRSAPPYDTSRHGRHMLADAGGGGEPAGWTGGPSARWYTHRLSEVELVLCFKYEEVVADTCGPYRTATGDFASNVVLAKVRWSIRLLEARTGLVVDSLQVEGHPQCPHVTGAATGYLRGDWGDGPEASVTIWERVAPLVEPALPGPRSRRACDGGDMLACSNLGLMYATGHGAPQSDARAAEFYRRACEGGEPSGCSRIEAMHAERRGVPQGDTSAAEVLQRGCDGGDMKRCTILGVVYANGRGVTKNPTRAAEFYRRACDGGNDRGTIPVGTQLGVSGAADMDGCYNLGAMYAIGEGVDHSDTLAVAFYRRACDGASMKGCVKLGEAYQLGSGVPRSNSRAVELYRRACDRGELSGCTSLGRMYGAGFGVPESDTLAVGLYRRACDGGDMSGCTDLGGAYADGRGVPRSDTRAQEFLWRACDGGDTNACLLLRRRRFD